MTGLDRTSGDPPWAGAETLAAQVASLVGIRDRDRVLDLFDGTLRPAMVLAQTP